MNIRQAVLKTALIGVVAMAINAHAKELNPEEFISKISAKGVAEIQTAKTALKKSESVEIRAFAQKMIEDHSETNKKLAKIAERKNYNVAENDSLKDKAKSSALNVHKEQSFDIVYAEHQVQAHEKTIELFKQATKSNDEDIRAFAQQHLPKLETHLRDAYRIVDIAKRAAGDEYHEQQANDGEGNPSRGVGTVPTTKFSD